MCIDMRANNAVERGNFPVPTLDEIIQELEIVKFLAKLTSVPQFTKLN